MTSATTGTREQPVEMGRVEPVGDVGEADRSAALDPGQQVDHPQRRERVAGLADRRRGDPRVGQSRGGRPERAEADRRGRRIGRLDFAHGVSVTTTGSPTGSLGIRSASLSRGPGGCQSPPPTWANLYLLDIPRPTHPRHAAPSRETPGCRTAPRASGRHRRTRVSHVAPTRTRPDPDRTDHRTRPPAATSGRARSLPGAGDIGGRPRASIVAQAGGHRGGTRGDVHRRDRGRHGGRASPATPSPASAPDKEFALDPRGLGHAPQAVRGPRGARRPGARLRARSRA